VFDEIEITAAWRERQEHAANLDRGCGYVGEATADLFHSAGWDVEGWVHSKESSARLSVKPYSIRVIDVSQRGEVLTRGSIRCSDPLCQLACGDAEPMSDLPQRRASSLETFPKAKILFTSSTSVYAQRDGSWVTEESETKPLRDTGRIF